MAVICTSMCPQGLRCFPHSKLTIKPHWNVNNPLAVPLTGLPQSPHPSSAPHSPASTVIISPPPEQADGSIRAANHERGGGEVF